jgi:SHS2 domain-containing protein
MNPAGPAPQPGWSHFPHGADIGVRGSGPTPAAAFEQAACALFAAVVDLATVRATATVEIACAAPSLAVLLSDWLNALIYEMATRNMVFGRFEVTIADGRLSGRAHGEPIDSARHMPAVEPKGATMTALRVAQERDGSWVAECVVDV